MYEIYDFLQKKYFAYNNIYKAWWIFYENFSLFKNELIKNKNIYSKKITI